MIESRVPGRFFYFVPSLAGVVLAAMIFSGCAGSSSSDPTDAVSQSDAAAAGKGPVLVTAEQAAGGDSQADSTSNLAQDAVTEASEEGVYAGPAPQIPAYSGGVCPNFSNGGNTIQSGGRARVIEVSLPSNPANAPVLFIYHGSGDSPQNMLNFFNASATSANEGAIVVAPSSCCGFVEWPFTTFEDPGPDLSLFDDVLACLEQQFDIDSRRIYSTGFSAGALWTTKLVAMRGQYLAAAATLSGGVGLAVTYETSAYDLPVLVAWGGASDMRGLGIISINFENESQALISNLQSDGHYVVQCDHGGGHTVPWGGEAWVKDFLFDQVWDDGGTIYQESLPDGFPAYCIFP